MARWILIITILMLSACSGPGVDAYHRGNDAYERGDYHRSFADYLYAANAGVTPAQYAVAYQYYYGQGTTVDQANAVMWFKRAAPHSERATYALHLINAGAPKQPWSVNAHP